MGVSFNAATAFVPWRTKNSYTAWKDVTPASMRPRPSCRGEPTRSERELRRLERRFNAATAFVPWRTILPVIFGAREDGPLQCGHGLRAVENDFGAETYMGQFQPSMRPRPSCRGERQGGQPAAADGHALQCGHGLRAVENLLLLPLFILWRYHLQCGHGLRAVENGQANTITVAALAGLQCGHGLRAVENACGHEPLPSRKSLQCGHGLRAVENANAQFDDYDPIYPLQCGHGLRAVENLR